MGLKSFTVSEGRYDGSKFLEPIKSDFLRCDMLLERQCVHAAELTGVSIRWKSVVCTRCVISATKD